MNGSARASAAEHRAPKVPPPSRHGRPGVESRRERVGTPLALPVVRGATPWGSDDVQRGGTKFRIAVLAVPQEERERRRERDHHQHAESDRHCGQIEAEPL